MQQRSTCLGFMIVVFLSPAVVSLRVLAQVAEVPAPDRKGDFKTALVLGNRGYYPNQYWLVVDPVRLNCRVSPTGGTQQRLPTGAILQAVFSGSFQEIGTGKGDAIVLHQGDPWLKVKPLPVDRPDWGEICYVRANARFIAPMNEDFVEVLQKR